MFQKPVVHIDEPRRRITRLLGGRMIRTIAHTSSVLASTIAVAATLALSVSGVDAATSGLSNPDELSGGKVPMRVLIDNDKVRVSLLTFPAGYVRSEHFSRRSDQILVYLDDGEVDRNGHRPVERLQPRGSVSWDPKGGDAAPLRVTKDYRAVYVELKHGTSTAPDPLAAHMAYAQVPSGGAPARVLMDNALFRATLISFPAGFVRAGGFKRRYDTVIAYIDDAELEDLGPPQTQYAVVKAQDHPDGPAVCDRIRDCDSVGPDGRWANGTVTLRGTVAWHPKDGYVENMRIGRNYRAVYIELKD
jgi:hypothetical protein